MLLVGGVAVAAFAIVAGCIFGIVQYNMAQDAQRADFQADIQQRFGSSVTVVDLREEDEDNGTVFELVVQFRGTECKGTLEFERTASFSLFPSWADTPKEVEDYTLDEVLVNRRWIEARVSIGLLKWDEPVDSPAPKDVEDYLTTHKDFEPLCK